MASDVVGEIPDDEGGTRARTKGDNLTFARILRHLLETVPKPGTNPPRPYSLQELAAATQAAAAHLPRAARTAATWSKPYLSDVINGWTDNPSRAKLNMLARVFGVSPAVFFVETIEGDGPEAVQAAIAAANGDDEVKAALGRLDLLAGKAGVTAVAMNAAKLNPANLDAIVKAMEHMIEHQKLLEPRTGYSASARRTRPDADQTPPAT